MTIKFLISPAVSITNGSKTLNVTGGVDTYHIFKAEVIISSNPVIAVVEGASGSGAPDGSGNSTITLAEPWALPDVVNEPMVALNTNEGMVLAQRDARDAANKLLALYSNQELLLTSTDPQVFIDIGGVSTPFTPWQYSVDQFVAFQNDQMDITQIDFLDDASAFPPIIDRRNGLGKTVYPVRDGGTTHIDYLGRLVYDASPDATNILPLVWVTGGTATVTLNAAIAHDGTLTASKLDFLAVDDTARQDSGVSAVDVTCAGGLWLSGEEGTTITIEITNRSDSVNALQVRLTNKPKRYNLSHLFGSTIANIWLQLKKASGDTAIFCYADSEQAELSNVLNGSVGVGSGTSLDGINQELLTANGVETQVAPENFFIHSDDTSDDSWGALGGATKNTSAPEITNPDGSKQTTEFTLASGLVRQDITASVLVSVGFWIYITDKGSAANVRVDFSDGLGILVNIEDVPLNTFTKIEALSVTDGGLGSSIDITLTPLTIPVKFYLALPQVNDGDFLHSYIPTDVSPATGFNTKYLFDYQTHCPDSTSDYSFVWRGRVLGSELNAVLLDAGSRFSDNSGGLAVQVKGDNTVNIGDGRGKTHGIPSPFVNTDLHTLSIDFIGLIADVYFDGLLLTTFTRGTAAPTQPPIQPPTLGRAANDANNSSLQSQTEFMGFFSKPLGAAGHKALGGNT